MSMSGTEPTCDSTGLPPPANVPAARSCRNVFQRAVMSLSSSTASYE
jgi:hypothetical protein